MTTGCQPRERCLRVMLAGFAVATRIIAFRKSRLNVPQNPAALYDHGACFVIRHSVHGWGRYTVVEGLLHRR